MKYTPEQLKQMARTALAARDARDPRFAELVARLCQRTGLGTMQVQMQILLMAV